MRRVLLLLCLFAVSLTLGCMKKPAEEYYSYAEESPPPPPPPAAPEMDDGGSASMTKDFLERVPTGRSYQTTVATTAGVTATRATTSFGREKSVSDAAPAPSQPRTESSPTPPANKPKDTAEPAATTPAPKRMMHYNGWVRLRVTRTDALVDDVAKLAASMGGYTEQITTTRITVRVPVDRFKEAYGAVQKMGDVMDRSMTAEDVTDSFMAIDLRAQTSRASRDRLVELLAQAKTEKEKLALLQQIQRLTEEIDVMESQLRTLSSLASMSRLTVDGVARQAFAGTNGQEDVTRFRWISQLSPYRRNVAADGDLLELPVPSGFVALDVKKRFITESADGAVFWASRHDNDPEGDADYWISAISSRLASEFAKDETSTVGEWRLLRLVETGDDPYTYIIGVRVQGKHLDLTEIYYPTADHERRYDAAVRAVLGGQS